MLYFIKNPLTNQLVIFNTISTKNITWTWTQLTLEMLPLISLRFGEDHHNTGYNKNSELLFGFN